LKAMEALQVQFDGTVRNAEGYIVDFLYGGDGMDAQFLEPCSLFLVKLNNEQMLSTFQLSHFDETLDPNWKKKTEEEFKTLMLLRDECRRSKRHLWTGEVDATALLPVHIPRVMQNVLDVHPSGEPTREERVTPSWLLMEMDKLLHVLHRRFRHTATGILYLEAMLRSYISSSHICVPHAGKWWSKSSVNDLLDRIERLFLKSSADAGEMVGALASESIGEPATQLTLNTFHYSGVGNKNTTTGVPRLRELIDVTKSDKMKTPSLTLALQPQYATNRDACAYFAQTLIRTSLGDLVEKAETVWEPDVLRTTVPEDVEMVRAANIFRNHAALLTSSRWVIRLTLHRTLVLNRGLTPMDLANTIREFVGERADVVYSPTNTAKWVVRISLFDIREMAVQYSNDVPAQVAQERVLTQTEMNRLLARVAVGGIDGLSDASLRQIKCTAVDEQTGSLTEQKEWVIDTQGTSMLEAWTLDGVDWTRTISNDLYEIYENLGIEAVAQVLFSEIKNVLADSYVNDRHITAVVKTMCFRGYLMPMSRHGINRVDTGVLMRVSFEESMEQLMNAAMFNEVDTLKGVTENMMVGAVAPMGTGTVSLVVDPQYQVVMDHIVYGRKRQRVRKQRIFRSMITEWNSNVSQPQDDLDQLDRPPSPPTTPLFHGSGPAPMAIDSIDLPPSSVFDSTSASALPSNVFLPPPMMFSGSATSPVCTDAGNAGKRYRPSSPDLSADEPVAKRPRPSLEFTSLTLGSNVAVESIYRPSSPDISGLMEAATLPEMPISQQIAPFIPVGRDVPLFLMPPPGLFKDSSVKEATTPQITLLPDEPATESKPSEPLLLTTASITDLLNSLAPFLTGMETGASTTK